MARKKEVKQEPKPAVTKIPLPISDSALVIDLPDGQKLLVGKMEHGTVIEVATWRGTGRPDSRTNRMMLGMSNAEIEEELEQSQESSVQSIRKLGWQQRSLAYPMLFIRWLLNLDKGVIPSGKQSAASNEPGIQSIDNSEKVRPQFFSRILAIRPNQIRGKFSKSKNQGDLNGEITSGESSSKEVDEWLEKIVAKTRIKAEEKIDKNSQSKILAKAPETKARKSAKSKKLVKKPAS